MLCDKLYIEFCVTALRIYYYNTHQKESYIFYNDFLNLNCTDIFVNTRCGIWSHQAPIQENVVGAWPAHSRRLALIKNVDDDMYVLHNHIKNWSRSQFLKYAVNEFHGQGETVVTP